MVSDSIPGRVKILNFSWRIKRDGGEETQSAPNIPRVNPKYLLSACVVNVYVLSIAMG